MRFEGVHWAFQIVTYAFVFHSHTLKTRAASHFSAAGQPMISYITPALKPAISNRPRQLLSAAVYLLYELRLHDLSDIFVEENHSSLRVNNFNGLIVI